MFNKKSQPEEKKEEAKRDWPVEKTVVKDEEQKAFLESQEVKE